MTLEIIVDIIPTEKYSITKLKNLIGESFKMKNDIKEEELGDCKRIHAEFFYDDKSSAADYLIKHRVRNITKQLIEIGECNELYETKKSDYKYY